MSPVALVPKQKVDAGPESVHPKAGTIENDIYIYISILHVRPYMYVGSLKSCIACTCCDGKAALVFDAARHIEDRQKKNGSQVDDVVQGLLLVTSEAIPIPH